MEPLSPREIQARVRAGESPDVIAADTGWPLERVQRYAEPPQAERAFIAAVAQQAEVRRSGNPVMLAETVEIAMQRVGRSAEEVEWDAWRREDGRWIVTATAPGATATWTYDVSGRTVHALDDSARRLMGVEDALAEVAPAVTHERPYLVAVPEPREAQNSNLKQQGEDQDSDPSGTDASECENASEDSFVDQRARVEKRPLPDSLFPPESTDAAHADDIEEADKAGNSNDTVVMPRGTTDSSPGAKKPAPAAKKPKGRRASVPSWDEILFGTPRED